MAKHLAITAWAGAVLLYCALGAYLLGTSRPAEQPGVVTLRYAALNDSKELKIASEQAAAFEAGHPGVRVRVEPITDEGILVLTAGGVAPDVFFSTDVQVSDFARGNAALDIRPLAESDPDFNLKDFYAPMVDLYRYQGGLYGLPRELASLVIFYNKDLFKQAGVPEPGEDWTWDDFLQTARRLTHTNPGDSHPDVYGFISSPDWQAERCTWVWQNGGEVFSPDLKQCLIDQPAAEEAIQFYYFDLVKKYHVTPAPQDVRTDMTQEFITGRAAMLMAHRPYVPRLRDIKDFQWDVAPLPHQKVHCSASGCAGLSVSKMTKHPKEAWAFLKFLTGRDGLKFMADGGGAVPPRKSLAESNFFLSSTPPQRNDVFVKAAARGELRTVPVLPHQVEIEAVMTRELTRAFYDEQTVQQACQRIKKQVDRLLCE